MSMNLCECGIAILVMGSDNNEILPFHMWMNCTLYECPETSIKCMVLLIFLWGCITSASLSGPYENISDQMYQYSQLIIVISNIILWILSVFCMNQNT